MIFIEFTVYRAKFKPVIAYYSKVVNNGEQMVYLIVRMFNMTNAKCSFLLRWITISSDGWQKNCKFASRRIQDAQTTTRGQ